ncbi:MAG: pyridoxamine 5'-phosphate oxidase family protein [Puniceicoccaceae bacterium]
MNPLKSKFPNTITTPPFSGTARSVIDTSQWFSIATTGAQGPHLAACWTRNILALGYSDQTISIPVWRLQQTERNLTKDPRMQLLFVSSKVVRAAGPGQGLTVSGTGTIHRAGPLFEEARQTLQWIHGVLMLSIHSWNLHLP